MEVLTEEPEPRPIDTRLLVGIGVGGALIGLLASFGALPGVLELVAWIVVGAVSIIAVLRRIPQDAFRHLAFAFMIAGFVAADVKILLWDRFLANNPELVAAAQSSGAVEVPRTALLLSDTVTGAVFGLIFGLVARALAKRQQST